MILGIDASNLRVGGGVHHLVELLRVSDPKEHDFVKVVVWGGQSTLRQIEDRSWLVKVHLPVLDRGLLQRSLWQRFQLAKLARLAGCHVLFVPGGSYAGDFHPMVTMSQNLLPFEWGELRRFGWSWLTLKMLLLRWTQSRTFRQASGVIFLTRYARDTVNKVVKVDSAKSATIAHGIHERFTMAPRVQKPISDYSPDNPYRILYVSTVDVFKHQWQVAMAVAQLRESGLPLVLELVGAAYSPALSKLNNTIDKVDPDRKFVRYWGSLPYDTVHDLYAAADLFVFASSCETFSQIVTEAMSAGLPIACSSRSAMHELLGCAGIYFDPESSDDIARAIRELIDCPTLRATKAQEAFNLARHFTWRRCAHDTFLFLRTIAREPKVPAQARPSVNGSTGSR